MCQRSTKKHHRDLLKQISGNEYEILSMIAFLTDIVLTIAAFLLILLAAVVLREKVEKRSNKYL